MRNTIANLILLFVSASFMVAATFSTPAYAADCYKNKFLTLPHWYRDLPLDGDCHINMPDKSDANALQRYVTIIIINIIEIIMHLVAYASVIMIIVGGFRYMISRGDSSRINEGKMTIRNAVIGLVVSMIAVIIVNIILGVVK